MTHITSPESRVDILQVTTNDVLEQAEALPFWSQRYTQLGKGEFSGRITSVYAENIQIFREYMNRSVEEYACAPEDSYVIGLPTIIEGESHWRGGFLEKNSLITLSCNAELNFKTSEPSEIRAVVIPEYRLEAYAREVEDLDLKLLVEKVNPVETISYEAKKELLSALYVGTDYISNLPEQLDLAETWRYVEDNLLNACMKALLNASQNEVRFYDHRVHRHLIQSVRDIIMSNQTEPVTIGDLCRILHVSRRTLNHAFNKVLGITPVAYMRNIRLHHIREEILNHPHEIMSIAHIASKWGFWHMSLFARYYRELFGECPSDTLERAKTRGAKIIAFSSKSFIAPPIKK